MLLTKEQTTRYFEDNMEDHLKAKIRTFGDRDIVKVYLGKLFIVYSELQPEGLKVITTLKVVDFGVDRAGMYIAIMDQRLRSIYKIGYTPTLLCGYDLFASVPSKNSITMSVKKVGDKVYEDLSCMMLIKQRVAPHLRNKGVINCLSLDKFKHAFPLRWPAALMREV